MSKKYQHLWSASIRQQAQQLAWEARRDKSGPYMKYGAPVSYPSGMSVEERDKLLELDDFTFDLCIVNAREVVVKAINKMMGC